MSGTDLDQGRKRRQLFHGARRSNTIGHAASSCVLFRGPINACTGYGLLALQMIAALDQCGRQVVIEPTDFDETFVRVPERVYRRMVWREERADWELLLTPPRFHPRPGRKTVYFTMWESSRLPKEVVGRLNAAECVLVPSRWNAKTFKASGVIAPIHVIPLGVDQSAFDPARIKQSGPCVFGTGGRTAGGGARKGFGDVIHAFQKAFPAESDVRLDVKCFPDCDVPSVSDERVRVIRKFFSPSRMTRWFRSLTCFVSASRGEGWGLMQHQALATGRPVISVQYGGVADFFDRSVGYPIAYRLVRTSGYYTGCGMWAEPDQRSLVRQMRRVYENRVEAAERGKRGAARVLHLTWPRFHADLVETLHRVGMLRDAA